MYGLQTKKFSSCKIHDRYSDSLCVRAMYREHFRLLDYQILKKHALGPFSRKRSHIMIGVYTASIHAHVYLCASFSILDLAQYMVSISLDNGQYIPSSCTYLLLCFPLIAQTSASLPSAPVSRPRPKRGHTHMNGVGENKVNNIYP